MTRNGSAPEFDFDPVAEEAGPVGPSPVDWALFFLRAPTRRKLLFTAVLVAGVAAVFAFYGTKQRIYRVEAKILAQQQVLPSSLHGGAEDRPARTAWEIIHRRDNILSIIKNAKLLPEHVEKPEGLRARLGLAKPGDPLDGIVTQLDRKLLVNVEEGTISISLDWPDPEQAYAIVDGSLQNFIETRHVQEVTAIDEVLSVLRVRAANAKDQLDRVTEDVRRELTEGARDARGTPVAPPSRGASDEVIRLKSLLDSKERAIADVEEFRRRRLADLHANLDEKRTTFSDAHPVIIQLRQDIDALAKPSPQVLTLQEEAAKLRADYQAKLAQDAAVTAGGASPLSVRPAAHPRDASRPIEEDERVRDARFQYQQIQEHVNAAQIELDAVRAAFKYRYNVVWPPQIPREPISPNPVKILGAGFALTLFLAFLAAAIPELTSGRIVERWQVERGLGITVLAEIEKKK